MTYRVTITDTAGVHTYTAIGDRNSLMDAAYDRGALGVTLVVRR